MLTGHEKRLAPGSGCRCGGCCCPGWGCARRVHPALAALLPRALSGGLVLSGSPPWRVPLA